MPQPVALPAAGGIVRALVAQEFGELRITLFHLRAAGVAMIRQEKTAAERGGQRDERAVGFGQLVRRTRMIVKPKRTHHLLHRR